MIICKRLDPLDDQLQEAGSTKNNNKNINNNNNTITNNNITTTHCLSTYYGPLDCTRPQKRLYSISTYASIKMRQNRLFLQTKCAVQWVWQFCLLFMWFPLWWQRVFLFITALGGNIAVPQGPQRTRCMYSLSYETTHILFRVLLFSFYCPPLTYITPGVCTLSFMKQHIILSFVMFIPLSTINI